MTEENDGAIFDPRVCSHGKTPGGQFVWISGLEDEEAIIEPVKICDACRRILCTCERCSAYVDGLCCARPSRIHHNPDDWCRDGWKQARPWTMAEVREWLGLEVAAVAESEPDPRPTEWTARCPKFGSGESVDQRRGEPCPHCGDPRGHWPEEG